MRVNQLNQSVMSYASMNYEKFGEFKNIPANKQRVIKAGTPVITFTDIFGKNYFFPYRTKKQRSEISEILRLLKSDNVTLNRILADYSVKMGKYVNEAKLRRELKAEFGFTKSAIDSIIAAH
jgi:hypothetical protein